MTCFPEGNGFAVGSVEGRVAIQYLEDTVPSANFSFKVRSALLGDSVRGISAYNLCLRSVSARTRFLQARPAPSTRSIRLASTLSGLSQLRVLMGCVYFMSLL